MTAVPVNKELRTSPSILLLHGYACSSKDWGLVPHLLSGEHDARAIDFPGHGDSTLPAPNSIDQLISFTLDHIHENFDSPPVLAGHSMGGMVAMAIAAGSPAATSGIVLLDCFPHLATAVEVLGGAEDPTDPFGFGSVMDRHTPTDVQQWIRRSMSEGVKRTGDDLFQSLLEFDIRDGLAGVVTPSLLILGDRGFIGAANMQDVVNRLGYGPMDGLEVLTVPSHHFVMLECPELVAKDVGAFVQGLSAG